MTSEHERLKVIRVTDRIDIFRQYLLDIRRVRGRAAIAAIATRLISRDQVVNGRHAVFFKVTTAYGGWTKTFFENKALFELKSFVFMK